MRVLEKVLWAVDFNQGHDVSTEKFEKIYKQFGNDIVILNVLDPKLRATSFSKLIENSIAVELNKLRKRFNHIEGLNIKTMVRYGSVADTIIEISENENVNAVFVNQGSGEDYRKLGVNAVELLQNSNKPVVIISEEDKSEANGILVAVDFSDPSKTALKNAIIHAKESNLALKVISVFAPIVDVSPRLLLSYTEINKENEKFFENFNKEFDSFLEEVDFLGLQYEKVVVRGDVASEIANQAKKADILYMGSTGRSGLKRVFLGSIAEKVAQMVPADMVITKSENVFSLKMPIKILDLNNHFSIASKLVSLGYYDKAIENYLECININPMHIPSIKGLINVYSIIGKPDKAALYEQVYDDVIEQLNNWKIEDEIRRYVQT